MPAAITGAPMLETARLRLRLFRDDDLDAYADLCADPLVMRFLSEGRTLDRVEAWRQMAMFLGHWHLRGFGVWAVEERATGSLIGRIGFFQPEGWPDFELVWTLARSRWGNGFATEGARAALAHAFTTLGRDRVVSFIHPDNRASIRVAERLGMQPDGTAEVLGRTLLLYAIRREEWALPHAAPFAYAPLPSTPATPPNPAGPAVLPAPSDPPTPPVLPTPPDPAP